jgi:hypothetical protein
VEAKEAAMAEQRTVSDIVPEKFGGLIVGFRELLEKYPDAARHFSLAFHPDGTAGGEGEVSGTATTVAIPVIVFECEEFEPGLMDCRRVHKQ